MNEEDFWIVINSAQSDPRDATKDVLRRIEGQVMNLSLREMLDLAALTRYFINKADATELAIAGGIICGLPNALGLDSFLYFRGWLILQGEFTYSKSVLEPDTLADVSIDRDTELGINCPFCEELLYVTYRPFTVKSGGKGVESWKEVVPDWVPPKIFETDRFNNEVLKKLDVVKITDAMANKFPRLWEKFRMA